MRWQYLVGISAAFGLAAAGSARADTQADDPHARFHSASEPADDLPLSNDPLPDDDDALSGQAEIIALERERFERMTVPVTIMGQGPFRFIVDTGAQVSVLSHTLAEQLALTDRSPATLIGLNSQRQIETAPVPEVTLGSRSFLIQSAALVDPLHIGAADGVLGVDSLQHQRVLLDFVAGRIHVADADEARGSSGFEIIVRARRKLGQLVITRARIDGVRTAIIVDSGAQGSIGNPALLARLRRARVLGDSLMTDINGIESTGAVRVARALAIGSARIEGLPIAFTDSPTFRALGLADEPTLLLGMSELRLFKRVAIDFSKSEVLFDLPDRATWPALARGER